MRMNSMYPSNFFRIRAWWLLLFFLFLAGTGPLFAHEIPSQFELPESYKDSTEEGKVWYFIGLAYGKMGSAPDSALLFLRQGEIVAREGGDSTAILTSVFNLGHFMMGRGLYQDALKYMYSGEKLAQGLRDTSNYLFLQFWKSRIYSKLNEHQKSIEVCESAFQEFGETGKGAWGLSYYGEALRGAGRFEEAREALLESEVLFRESGDRIGLIMVSARLAEIYRELGDFDKSNQYSNYAINESGNFGAYESYLMASTSKVEVHLALGETDSAEYRALLALKTTEEKQYFSYKVYLSQLLASIYEGKNDYKQALFYARKAAQIGDKSELEKVKIHLAVKDSEVLYDKLQGHNELLQEQKKAQIYMSLGMLSLVILFLGIGVALYVANRKTKEFNGILKKKNYSLDDLNQEKDMLMQIVAHDLKSPLNQVQGLRELLKLMGPLNDEQLEILQKMDLVVDRGIDLIKKLLELAALESGKLVSIKKEANLSESLQRLISEYKLQADKKNISLHLKLPESQVIFETDPDQYERIVENLLSNAIKYSPKGKNVWVELQERQQEIWTQVRDEGPGICEEDQRSLFMKFQKLSARPTDGESSNGLGLAIVKAFADQLGGVVKVQSELNKGSEFTLVLPSK